MGIESYEGSAAAKKYTLIKKKDKIYLSIEKDSTVAYPVTIEQIFADLQRRKIPYDPYRIEFVYQQATGEEIEIAPYIEGVNTKPWFKLTVLADKLKAYLAVLPFPGGNPADLYDLESLLKDHNIKVGIKTNLLPVIIEKQMEHREWLIAEGFGCVNGENAKLIYHFNPKGINIKPQELEDGSVDFYNLNLIQTVNTGAVIVEKVAATAGMNGKNVYGEETSAKPGKDIRLPVGKHTEAADNDTKLIATRAGHVVLTNNKVSIYPIYEVKGDVDFNTGNIRFPGNVKVNGNVNMNFEIEAAGDVEIAGNLAGTAKAEGNIQVKKGIVRGKAIADGCVYAKYIENGTVDSGNSVVITDAIMHSNTKAAKRISVGGKKGLLVGGATSAGEEISAKNIGSPVGTTTQIEVGIKPALRQEYKDICRNIITLTENYDKAQKVVRTLQDMKLKQGKLPPGKEELLNKFGLVQQQMHQELEQASARKQELEEAFEGMDRARILVSDTVYPGVNISMGKSVYTVLEEMKYLLFYLEDLDIKIGSLHGRGDGRHDGQSR